jgi:TM2 domain-containing membrane protein YozV
MRLRQIHLHLLVGVLVACSLVAVLPVTLAAQQEEPTVSDVPAESSVSPLVSAPFGNPVPESAQPEIIWDWDRPPFSPVLPQEGSGGKDPVIAGALSFFIPGLGSAYAGRIGWGLFWFFGTGIICGTAPILDDAYSYVSCAVTYIWNIADAVSHARGY